MEEKKRNYEVTITSTEKFTVEIQSDCMENAIAEAKAKFEAGEYGCVPGTKSVRTTYIVKPVLKFSNPASSDKEDKK